LRKWRKSWQADDVDSDAVLISFAGDATAAFGATAFLFEDFFWYPGPGMLNCYTMGYGLRWTVFDENNDNRLLKQTRGPRIDNKLF
jgi:hypothetical protein